MYFAIKVYDSDMSLTQTGRIQLVSTAKDKVISLNITPTLLASQTYVTGALSLTSSDKYMIIYETGTTYPAVPQSSSLAYAIDWSPCDRYTNFELHWENSFG